MTRDQTGTGAGREGEESPGICRQARPSTEHWRKPTEQWTPGDWDAEAAVIRWEMGEAEVGSPRRSPRSASLGAILAQQQIDERRVLRACQSICRALAVEALMRIGTGREGLGDAPPGERETWLRAEQAKLESLL